MDLDSSKEFGIGAIVYYVKGFKMPEKLIVDIPLAYLTRLDVEPIIFLSRVINGAELRYWPTELELTSIV